MNVSKENRKTINQQLIEGAKKHLEKGWVMFFGGKKYTVNDVVNVLQRRAESAHEIAISRAAWHAAIEADAALN